MLEREVEVKSTEYSTGLCTQVLPSAKRIYFYKTHLGLPPNETMNKYLGDYLNFVGKNKKSA